MSTIARAGRALPERCFAALLRLGGGRWVLAADDEGCRPLHVVLRYGTADPHGVGDVDAARQSRRMPVRLGTREGASAAELESRVFPKANVAPSTQSVEPPPPQPDGAPVVTRSGPSGLVGTGGCGDTVGHAAAAPGLTWLCDGAPPRPVEFRDRQTQTYS